MTGATRILHLEDSRRDADLIRDLLEADGTFCELVHVDSRARFEAARAEAANGEGAKPEPTSPAP